MNLFLLKSWAAQMLRNPPLAVSVVAVVCGLMVACGEQVSSTGKAFNDAAPDLKQTWDKAVSADKGNDYVAAATGYRSLLLKRASLSEAQFDAVSAASVAINQRMNAAANKGDAAAKQAVAQLMAGQGGR
jgi:hypothetical protein